MSRDDNNNNPRSNNGGILRGYYQLDGLDNHSLQTLWVPEENRQETVSIHNIPSGPVRTETFSHETDFAQNTPVNSTNDAPEVPSQSSTSTDQTGADLSMPSSLSFSQTEINPTGLSPLVQLASDIRQSPNFPAQLIDYTVKYLIKSLRPRRQVEQSTSTEELQVVGPSQRSAANEDNDEPTIEELTARVEDLLSGDCMANVWNDSPLPSLIQRAGNYVSQITQLLRLIRDESASITTAINEPNMDTLESLQVLTQVVEAHLDTQAAMTQLNLTFARELELLNMKLEEAMGIPRQPTIPPIPPRPRFTPPPTRNPRKKQSRNPRVQSA